MRYEVLVTEGAERDLQELVEYIATADSPANAERVLERLLAVIEGLASQPERYPHPRELQAVGVRDYRQAFFRPYRVIFRIIRRQVIVYLVVDGRRDMQSLLTRRLLRG